MLRSPQCIRSDADIGLIDTRFERNMLGAVAEEKETRAASRYEAVVATFIALLAVSVAGYTAYMQRQQVRAAVWPILEFDSSNGPNIHFTVSNKGVGPAIIRHVIVKVDGQPMKNWNEVLDKFHRTREASLFRERHNRPCVRGW